ncbi:Transport permease protein OS=Streptomyces alboniger OX=132473 GN=CP975_18250 PE=3 SV=1 [Streptomyces alboniger]
MKTFDQTVQTTSGSAAACPRSMALPPAASSCPAGTATISASGAREQGAHRVPRTSRDTWRPSTMVGYLLGDALRYTIASVVMLTVGMILGYRPDGGVGGVLAGILLLVVFSFAFSWIWTMFGLMLRTEKSVMGVSMMVIFPLTFLSNVFVDPKTMPGWLQAFVNNSPVTHVASAVRGLMAGDWPADEVAWSLGWAGLFLTVFGPITMRLYNRK